MRTASIAVLALLVFARAGRLDAQAKAPALPPSVHCRAGESAITCYDRALDLGVSLLKGRPDSVTLERQVIGLMLETCGMGAADGCWGAGRFLLRRGLADTTAAGRVLERQSADLFARGCRGGTGSASACNDLGEAFDYQMGRDNRPDSALFFYHAACVAGSGNACARAATRYSRLGEFAASARDSNRIIGRLSCVRGSLIGCITLANQIEGTLNRTPTAARGDARFRALRDSALRLIRMACDSGLPLGCAGLAKYYGGIYGLPRDVGQQELYASLACMGDAGLPPQARPPGRRLPVMRAEQGRGTGCEQLGRYMLDTTMVAHPDTAAALGAFSMGCEAFLADACVRYAVTPRPGGTPGLSPDAKLIMLTSACREGSEWGCDNVGWFLDPTKDGGFPAPDEAARYYGLSCDMGDPNGCNNYGRLAETVLKNFDLATKYYRRACSINSEFGCKNLGSLLDSHFHRPDLAIPLYAAACELDNESACRLAIEGLVGQGKEAEAARLRTVACRLARSYCVGKPADGTP